MSKPYRLLQESAFFFFSVFIFFRNLFAFNDFLDITVMAFSFLLLGLSVFFSLPHIKLQPNFYIISSLFCMVVLVVSWGYNYDRSSGIKFTIVTSIIWLLSLFFCFISGWVHHMERAFLFFGLFHMGITCFEIFLPSAFELLIPKILPDDQVAITIRFLSSRVYSGITGQTGVLAFFCVILICLFFGRLMSNGLRLKDLVCFLLPLLILVITGKRGLLIAVSFSLVVMVFFLLCKKNLRGFLFACSVCLVVAPGILLAIPQTRSMLLKTFSAGALSGRGVIYQAVWQAFSTHPLLGNGIGSIGKILTDGSPITGITVSTGHNIYLQLLAEVGVIGFSVFMFMLFFTLIDIFLKTNEVLHENKKAPELPILFYSLSFQIFFLIYGLSGNPLFDYTQFSVYCFAVAGAYSSYYHRKQEVLSLLEDTVT